MFGKYIQRCWLLLMRRCGFADVDESGIPRFACCKPDGLWWIVLNWQKGNSTAHMRYPIGRFIRFACCGLSLHPLSPYGEELA
jgi:hypothetical protein